jgi:hypothetical protein
LVPVPDGGLTAIDDRITTDKESIGRPVRVDCGLHDNHSKQSVANVLRAVPSLAAKTMKIGDLELRPRLRHLSRTMRWKTSRRNSVGPGF